MAWTAGVRRGREIVDAGGEAIADGQVDVIDAYTTDAKLDQLKLVVLADELGFFPRYDAVLLSDYGKGGLTHIARMIELARAAARGGERLVVAVGGDGTVYVGSEVAVRAYGPDGAARWTLCTTYISFRMPACQGGCVKKYCKYCKN